MFQFPANPFAGQTFTPVAGVTYRWSGTAWHLIAGPGAFLTPTDADTRYVNIEEAQNTTNRIINGKFAIDQRNAGAGALVNNASGRLYTLDRWQMSATGTTGALTGARIADAVYLGEYRLSATVQTTQATLPATAFYAITQPIEGYQVADLNFGTAQASPITVAFEVESSIAATLCLLLTNSVGDRSYIVPFTVAAGVRETKVITALGDTTGTWERTSSNGLGVYITLGIGSTYHTATTSAWVGGFVYSTASATNFMATAGATLRLRNVRLYKGSVDFGPDRRLYAEELALCQRYYQKSFNQTTAPATNVGINTGEMQFRGILAGVATASVTIQLPVTMRAAPTATIYNPGTTNNEILLYSVGSFTSSITSNLNPSGFLIQGAQPAGAAANGLCCVHWTASAEL